jgi:hypothetical protein
LVTDPPPLFPPTAEVRETKQQTLLQNGDVKEVLGSESPHILFLSVPDESTETASFLHQHIIEDGGPHNVVSFFFFDPNDARYNTAEAMLNTVLVQLAREHQIRRIQGAVRSTVPTLGFPLNVTKTDLFEAFKDAIVALLGFPEDLKDLKDKPTKSAFCLCSWRFQCPYQVWLLVAK